ncbi:MAG: glycosyltransferase [Sulfuritalea sp.]|nr:glycosyltransferase [Sulfuritalea sp.]
MRIAVVTPYYRETPETLGRCLDSIQAQGMPVDHILVADGFPQYWVESRSNIRHLVLRENSGDFGDTPRSLGFMLGIRNDYDIVQFLDADNVLEPEHFGVVLGCFSQTGADMIVARRKLLRPDGSVIDVRIEEDEELAHVDTSCFVFSRRSFHVGIRWGFIPRPLGFIDDRVFLGMVKKSGLNIAVLPKATVGYRCMWSHVYLLAGETPPPGCRNLQPHFEAAKQWWNGLSTDARASLQDDLGVTINF